jgi:hypothetical protein
MCHSHSQDSNAVSVSLAYQDGSEEEENTTGKDVFLEVESCCLS